MTLALEQAIASMRGCASGEATAAPKAKTNHHANQGMQKLHMSLFWRH